jgi:hypothetical protein
MTLDPLDAAAQAIRTDAASRHPGLGALEIAGIGWATVELERAARELRATPAARWDAAPRDVLLGARCWRLVAEEPGGRAIVLLEPDTEGRLAAALARFGEGVAVIYLAAAGPDPIPTGQGGHAGGDASGDPAGSAGGPLGPARLVPGRPAWGPHVVLLDPAPAAEPA